MQIQESKTTLSLSIMQMREKSQMSEGMIGEDVL